MGEYRFLRPESGGKDPKETHRTTEVLDIWSGSLSCTVRQSSSFTLQRKLRLKQWINSAIQLVWWNRRCLLP